MIAALDWLSIEKAIPVSDFLHIWKNFCSRFKNHPVTLRPDSAVYQASALDLEGLFGHF
jgi:hypothetical protein